MSKKWKSRCSLVFVVAAAFACGPPAQAQDDAQNGSEQPKAVTASDAKIPIENLKLLVKPLTKEELVVEADAWRDELKMKVQEIAERQIAVKEEQEKVETEEEVEAAESDGATESLNEQTAAEPQGGSHRRGGAKAGTCRIHSGTPRRADASGRPAQRGCRRAGGKRR